MTSSPGSGSGSSSPPSRAGKPRWFWGLAVVLVAALGFAAQQSFFPRQASVAETRLIAGLPGLLAEEVLQVPQSKPLLLVDVRHAYEQPQLPPVPNALQVRLVWPGQRNPNALSQFYAALDRIAEDHPDRLVVITCARGVRTSHAMTQLPATMTSPDRIVHLVGGMHGNRIDPGLIKAWQEYSFSGRG